MNAIEWRQKLEEHGSTCEDVWSMLNDIDRLELRLINIEERMNSFVATKETNDRLNTMLVDMLNRCDSDSVLMNVLMSRIERALKQLSGITSDSVLLARSILIGEHDDEVGRSDGKELLSQQREQAA